jgi:hypothetical protein
MMIRLVGVGAALVAAMVGAHRRLKHPAQTVSQRRKIGIPVGAVLRFGCAVDERHGAGPVEVGGIATLDCLPDQEAYDPE